MEKKGKAVIGKNNTGEDPKFEVYRETMAIFYDTKVSRLLGRKNVSRLRSVFSVELQKRLKIGAIFSKK